MLFRIPYYCVLGGVFWTIVLSLCIATNTCVKSLKERSNTLVGFLSCMFLGCAILVALGTGLGWMFGQSPWLETRDVAAQLLDPYPVFGQEDNFKTREGGQSPDITKEDAEAFMAHLKSVPPLPPPCFFQPSRRKPPLTTSSPSVESKSPYAGVVSVC